jgi:hypothetical protein
MAPPQIEKKFLEELAKAIRNPASSNIGASVQAIIQANLGILRCEPPREEFFANEKNLTWLHIAFWEADNTAFTALMTEYEKPENNAPKLTDTLTNSAGVRRIEIYQLPRLALLQPEAKQNRKNLQNKIIAIIDKLLEAEKVADTKDKATKALQTMAQEALSLLDISNPEPAYFNTLCDEFAKLNRIEDLIAWLNASGAYNYLHHDDLLAKLNDNALTVALRLNIRPALSVIPLIEHAYTHTIIERTIERLEQLPPGHQKVVFYSATFAVIREITNPALSRILFPTLNCNDPKIISYLKQQLIKDAGYDKKTDSCFPQVQALSYGFASLPVATLELFTQELADYCYAYHDHDDNYRSDIDSYYIGGRSYCKRPSSRSRANELAAIEALLRSSPNIAESYFKHHIYFTTNPKPKTLTEWLTKLNEEEQLRMLRTPFSFGFWKSLPHSTKLNAIKDPKIAAILVAKVAETPNTFLPDLSFPEAVGIVNGALIQIAQTYHHLPFEIWQRVNNEIKALLLVDQQIFNLVVEGAAYNPNEFIPSLLSINAVAAIGGTLAAMAPTAAFKLLALHDFRYIWNKLQPQHKTQIVKHHLIDEAQLRDTPDYTASVKILIENLIRDCDMPNLQELLNSLPPPRVLALLKETHAVFRAIDTNDTDFFKNFMQYLRERFGEKKSAEFPELFMPEDRENNILLYALSRSNFDIFAAVLVALRGFDEANIEAYLSMICRQTKNNVIQIAYGNSNFSKAKFKEFCKVILDMFGREDFLNFLKPVEGQLRADAELCEIYLPRFLNLPPSYLATADAGAGSAGAGASAASPAPQPSAPLLDDTKQGTPESVPLSIGSAGSASQPAAPLPGDTKQGTPESVPSSIGSAGSASQPAAPSSATQDQVPTAETKVVPKTPPSYDQACAPEVKPETQAANILGGLSAFMQSLIQENIQLKAALASRDAELAGRVQEIQRLTAALVDKTAENSRLKGKGAAYTPKMYKDAETQTSDATNTTNTTNQNSP